jgi:hypothetical protein
MVDDAQNTNTTQSGSSPTTGSALQPLAQTGLQPQSTNNLQTPESSNLQPTTNQTINAINQLDQGGSSISLRAVTGTATTTQPVISTPVKTKQIFVYGGAAVIVAAIMAVMVYRLLRPN